ncbi:MAG: globin [Candidatus Kariarchaeaceae archaeon]
MEKTVEQLFMESYTRIQRSLDQDDQFYEVFYESFIPRDPKYGLLFQTSNFRQQYSMLNIAMFQFYTYIISGINIPDLSRIREIHLNMHLTISDYENWKAAMVETVEKMDPEYSDEIGMAWTQIIEDCIEYILRIV